MTPNESQSSISIPEDFSAFEHWRNTGELPDAPATDAEETTEETSADSADSSSDSPAEPEQDASGSDPEDSQEPKSKRGIEKRFSQLTAKIRDLEAQLAGNRPAAAAVSGQSAPATPAAVAPEAQGEPVAADFKTYDDYVKALARFEVAQERAALERAAAQRKAQEDATAAQQSWREREKAITAEHPDYAEKLAAATIPISPDMHAAILSDENGPAIAYHLATHTDEAQRIAGMNPRDAVRAIGRLSARFDKAPEPPKPKVSSAPAPPRPVKATAPKAEHSVYDESLSFSDWERVRNAQLAKRR